MHGQSAHPKYANPIILNGYYLSSTLRGMKIQGIDKLLRFCLSLNTINIVQQDPQMKRQTDWAQDR